MPSMLVDVSVASVCCSSPSRAVIALPTAFRTLAAPSRASFSYAQPMNARWERETNVRRLVTARRVGHRIHFVRCDELALCDGRPLGLAKSRA